LVPGVNVKNFFVADKEAKEGSGGKSTMEKLAKDKHCI
jgi:hypothetical protein